MGASMRYLSQRFAMPYKIAKGALTDIGTEELGHLEIIGAIVHQLTRNLSPEEIEASGFGPYYIDHTTGIWPQAAGGVPFNACEFQSKGDPVTDLFENLAAEQKARSTYDNILRMVKDPEVCDPIRFLRMREIVHFQRFGEVLRDVQEHLDSRNFYAFNPAFDMFQGPDCRENGILPEQKRNTENDALMCRERGMQMPAGMMRSGVSASLPAQLEENSQSSFLQPGPVSPSNGQMPGSRHRMSKSLPPARQQRTAHEHRAALSKGMNQGCGCSE